mgnify:CR=1 FL=1
MKMNVYCYDKACCALVLAAMSLTVGEVTAAETGAPASEARQTVVTNIGFNGTATLTVAPNALRVVPGTSKSSTTFCIDVYLENTATIAVLDATVEVPAGVTLDDVTPTERVVEGTPISKDASSDGYNVTMGSSVTQALAVSGNSGKLCSLQMSASEAFASSANVVIKGVTAMDTNGNAKAFGDELTVRLERVERGNVNGEDAITANDASLVLQLVASKISARTEGVVYDAADVNGDGQVTAQDASLILQMVAGKK